MHHTFQVSRLLLALPFLLAACTSNSDPAPQEKRDAVDALRTELGITSFAAFRALTEE